MIKFQQSQALTSYFESFWSMVYSKGFSPIKLGLNPTLGAEAVRRIM